MKKTRIFAAAGLLVALGFATYQGVFSAASARDAYRFLSNGFFISALFLLCGAMIKYAADRGAFKSTLEDQQKDELPQQSGPLPPWRTNDDETRNSNRITPITFLIPGAIFMALALLFLLLYYLQPTAAQGAQAEQNTSMTEETMAKNPSFTITLENGQVLTGELYPETAPESVGNFVALANAGFYDGLIFHRVIPGFMIQGGCPDGTGMGGPGYGIKGEFSQNGVNNPLKHTRGVLSMARSMRMDSAGSQFFIMVADAPHLDGGYAAFGKVLTGMEAADAVVKVKRNNADRPNEDQVIKSIRVETHGVDYPFTRLSK